MGRAADLSSADLTLLDAVETAPDVSAAPRFGAAAADLDSATLRRDDECLHVAHALLSELCRPTGRPHVRRAPVRGGRGEPRRARFADGRIHAP